MGPQTSSSTVIGEAAPPDGASRPVIGDRDAYAGDVPMLLDRRRDVLVIRPLGRMDAGTIERVVQIVAGSSTPVIVDLDECYLADPTALADIADTALGDVEVCIVSGRLSCRRLLARAGVNARLAVFQRSEDALQVLLLAAAGFGRGWNVAPPGQVQSPTRTDTLTSTRIVRRATPECRLAVTIELHGELSAATAPQLHHEIDRLIDDGVTDLVIDLTGLRLCTSPGLDVFDQAHQRLHDNGNGNGALELQNAQGVVDRVLTIVEDGDPTFPSLRHTSAD